MSARPGLCGGHRATGVPTAISLTCEMGEQAAHACVIADYNGFRDSGVSTNRVGLNPNSF